MFFILIKISLIFIQMQADMTVLQSRVSFHANALQLQETYVDNAYLAGWRIYKDRIFDQVCHQQSKISTKIDSTFLQLELPVSSLRFFVVSSVFHLPESSVNCMCAYDKNAC